jgi:hypothetical protein
MRTAHLDQIVRQSVPELTQDERQNLLTVRREDGKQITYDPKRLQGVNVYDPKADRYDFTPLYLLEEERCRH